MNSSAGTFPPTLHQLWQKSSVLCNQTQENLTATAYPYIYVMYAHRNTYLQENVNTVYKETNWKKSNFQDKTVTLFLSVRIETSSVNRLIQAFYESVSVYYIHTESKTVHRALSPASSTKESMHEPLSIALTRTHLALIHINAQDITVSELCLSLIKTKYEASHSVFS